MFHLAGHCAKCYTVITVREDHPERDRGQLEKAHRVKHQREERNRI